MTVETAKEPVAEETQSDIDVDAATAEISSELFGQGAEEEKIEPAEGEGAEPSGNKADVVESPPQLTEEEQAAKDAEEAAAKEAETSAEVQEVGAPKTWTKEALAKWATVDPVVKAEIAKREEDFLKGITQYKAAADIGARYEAVVEPFKPMLAAENVDPVQLMQSFSANHYLLSKGTPEQKVELAAQLLAGYDIPLAELLNYIAENGSDAAPVDPAFRALEGEVKQLRNLISTAQNTNTERVSGQITGEIEAFAADPAHPYFDELAGDISKLFESGMASNLAEAYEKAVFANPNTRQKEIERLTAEARSSADAEAAARKEKVAKATADTVKVIPKSRDGTVPTGSIDDTLRETLEAIENRA